MNQGKAKVLRRWVRTVGAARDAREAKRFENLGKLGVTDKQGARAVRVAEARRALK
jgi:hypothetical protein